jgi:hypothetical protein
MQIGLNVKYPLFLSDFCHILIVQIFEKSWDIKFLENPFNGSRFIPCGRWTDMTRPIIACRNFANAPTNGPRTPKLLFHRAFTPLTDRLYSRDGICLLRGTYRIFKYVRLTWAQVAIAGHVIRDGQSGVFSKYFGFHSVKIISDIPHAHPRLHVSLTRMSDWRSLGTFQESFVLLEIWQHWIET